MCMRDITLSLEGLLSGASGTVSLGLLVYALSLPSVESSEPVHSVSIPVNQPEAIGVTEPLLGSDLFVSGVLSLVALGLVFGTAYLNYKASQD